MSIIVSKNPAVRGKDRDALTGDGWQAFKPPSIRALLHYHYVRGGAIAMARFRGGVRELETFGDASVLILDIDEPGGWTLEQYRSHPLVAKHAAAIVPSSRYTPEKPKAHIYFVLDRPVTDGPSYRAAWRGLVAKAHGLPEPDDMLKNPAGLLFGTRFSEIDAVPALDDGLVWWQEDYTPLDTEAMIAAGAEATVRTWTPARASETDSYTGSHPYALAALEQEAAQVAATKEGGRNLRLFNAARNLWDFVWQGAMSPGRMQTTLADAGQACGLSIAEVARTVAQGRKYARGRQIPAGTGAAAALYDQLSNAAREILHRDKQWRVHKLWRILHAAGVRGGELLTIDEVRAHVRASAIGMDGRTLTAALSAYNGAVFQRRGDEVKFPTPGAVDALLGVDEDERGKGDPLDVEHFATLMDVNLARLHALVRRLNASGRERIHNAWLADKLGVTVRTVQRYKLDLVEAGQLIVRAQFDVIRVPARADDLYPALPQGDAPRSDFLRDEHGRPYPATPDALSFARRRAGWIQHVRQRANKWRAIAEERRSNHDFERCKDVTPTSTQPGGIRAEVMDLDAAGRAAKRSLAKLRRAMADLQRDGHGSGRQGRVKPHRLARRRRKIKQPRLLS